MKPITEKIINMLPYRDKVMTLLEDVAYNEFLGYESISVDIIRLKPNDVMKTIGINSKYDVEIVTNTIVPNINEKSIEFRTPIAINESSHNQQFTNKCWDIYNELGDKRCCLKYLNGYVMLFCALPEKYITQNYLYQGIKMVESIAQGYRNKLLSCGFRI